MHAPAARSTTTPRGPARRRSRAESRIWPHDGWNGSPRPTNDERRLGQDGAGEHEHRVGDDQVDDVGQDVAAHDVAAAGADDAGPVDERALLQRQRLRPDDPGGRRPARDADDDDDDEQRRAGCPKSSLVAADDVADDRGQDDRQDERRQDQEEVGDAHQDARRSGRRRSPTTMPMTTPTKTVTTVASSPMTIEIRGAVDGQVEDVATELVGAEEVRRPIGGSSRGPVAVDRRSRAARRTAAGAMARTEKKTRMTRPISPSAAAHEAAPEVAPAARPASAGRRRGRGPRRSPARSCPHPRVEEAVDAGRRRGWPATTEIAQQQEDALEDRVVAGRSAPRPSASRGPAS